MKSAPATAGFTLAEMLIAMVGSSIIIGALLASSVSLQKVFRASELYAASHADQRRLIDYLARDLRRAVAIGTSARADGGDVAKLAAESVTVEGETALVLVLPGYYKGNVPAEGDYDEPLPVVVAERRVDYGSDAGVAPGVRVMFRKIYVAEENAVCFVRDEVDARRIIVRHAAELSARLTLGADGTTCAVEVEFASPIGSRRPVVVTHDQIMLRNNRID